MLHQHAQSNVALPHQAVVKGKHGATGARGKGLNASSKLQTVKPASRRYPRCSVSCGNDAV